MNYEVSIEILAEIISRVGKFQIKKFKNRAFKHKTKSTNIEIVTEVDITSEKMLMDQLKVEFPDFGFLAEESGEKDISNEYIWVIDPLDGTTNFSVGLPIFAISIALQKNGESVLGAIHLPLTGDTYTAIKGMGAYKNSKQINVSQAKTLRDSVIATGFPYDRQENPVNNVIEFSNMVTEVKGIRRLGAAAYDFCLLAEGVYSGYWEYGLKIWDYAAGLLIATEAGAVFEMLSNRDHSMIVSNPYIFDEFKEKLLKSPK